MNGASGFSMRCQRLPLLQSSNLPTVSLRAIEKFEDLTDLTWSVLKHGRDNPAALELT